MHLYWQDLGWYCYLSFFANLQQSYDPWFMSEFWFTSKFEFLFPLNILWTHWQNFTKFYICDFILTRSMFGLLHIIFTLLFQSYGPWLTPKFNFHSICWEQYWALILARSRLGLLPVIFANLWQGYGPWITSEFLFCSISW